MTKKPDIKTRKKLRITMCIFYLMQVIFCTFPFIQDVKPNADGIVQMASPFNLFLLIFGVTSDLDPTIIGFAVICIALILIPVIGFFFCALDKERNIKNIVSVLCCFAGVILILSIDRNYLSIGAIFALIVYLLIMFLTSIAMVMRLSKE